jgi:hypothetical protein
MISETGDELKHKTTPWRGKSENTASYIGAHVGLF